MRQLRLLCGLDVILRLNFGAVLLEGNMGVELVSF